MGKTIGAGLRATDLPARIGGDEFAVILPGTPVEEAETVARKVLALFDTDLRGAPRDPDGRPATVSVGVAPIEGLPMDAMEDADAALYRAKRAGGNTHAVAPSRLRSAATSA